MVHFTTGNGLTRCLKRKDRGMNSFVPTPSIVITVHKVNEFKVLKRRNKVIKRYLLKGAEIH